MGQVIPIRIYDSSNTYENKVCYGALIPSAVTGGFRPNYQQQTGYWAIVPQIPWNGYPDKLGRFVVLE
jgi:hypothetical protein